MPTTAFQAEDLKRELTQCLGADLVQVNLVLQRKLKSSSEFVTDVTDHVSRFRGKQVRPMLALLFERLSAGQASQKGHTLAAAVEMIHMATLVHDDVIDEAETRRHVATVHQRWDTETSVLLGDYLFSKAFHLAASSGDAEACRLIGLATDRTCEGELNQVAARSNRATTELDYFRIIRDKTGQLFGLSCLLGARSANASIERQNAARRFGVRLGLAFQIADDLLDLTGDEASTGKDVGNDLQNGRLTLPILRALKFATKTEQERIMRAIGGATVEANLVEMPCIRQGIESAAATAEELVRRAIKDLERFGSGREQQLLESLALFAVARKR